MTRLLQSRAAYARGATDRMSARGRPPKLRERRFPLQAAGCAGARDLSAEMRLSDLVSSCGLLPRAGSFKHSASALVRTSAAGRTQRPLERIHQRKARLWTHKRRVIEIGWVTTIRSSETGFQS